MYDHGTLRIHAKQVEILENTIKSLKQQRKAYKRHGVVFGPAFEHEISEHLKALQASRRAALRQCVATVKGTPLGDYVETTKGLGPKLLFVLGCGPDVQESPSPKGLQNYYGGATKNGQAVKHTKGEQSNFSQRLRAYMAMHVAEAAFKQGDYRPLYLQRRQETEDRDWSDGRKHADARRIVWKEILKDVWRVVHGYEPLFGTVQGAPKTTSA